MYVRVSIKYSRAHLTVSFGFGQRASDSEATVKRIEKSSVIKLNFFLLLECKFLFKFYCVPGY